MARPDLKQLYQELLDSKFRFMSRGEQHLHDVYQAVKERFPDLCDDTYLCRDNCSRGHDQPEWKHTVRKALDRLKASSGPVSKGNTNYWIFN